MLKIGVIGLGYWGPNIVRNFNAIEGVRVLSICDIDPNALKRAKEQFHNLQLLNDYRDITTAVEIDAVAIVTPVFTHFELAKNALENGKHVFVEKPFTSTSKEAEELIEIAERRGLIIMVDHTFIFTGAVIKTKEIIESGELGDIYYYDSMRVNLGLFQHDVNVVWDLAPHDFSILDYVLKEKPSALMASGIDHFGRGLENIAYITAFFDNNLIAHFNVNWLSPVKVRTTMVGGQKKMLLWNDLERDEKIKVYDKGVEIRNKHGLYRLLIDYRSGDMWAPKIDQTEALQLETIYFVDCILNNEIPLNDGHAGLTIVRMLEATDISLKQGGKIVKI